MACCFAEWHCAIDLIYIDAEHIECVDEETGLQLIILVVCHPCKWKITHLLHSVRSIFSILFVVHTRRDQTHSNYMCIATSDL